MFKSTLRNRVLYVRRLAAAGLVLLSVFLLLLISLRTADHAYATPSDTVNFQARLQTASGAIVPDGYYNVEFKLYNVSTGGTALWTEDYTATSGAGGTDVRIQVKDGYLSAALGSITAFPSSLDWSQQLYLTMNIGGTGTSPSWDGEMNPRLAMTATPYSFLAQRATQADKLSTTNGSYTSTLSIQGPTGGNQTFVVQDQGSAGTYDLLTTSQANSDYIQLQTGSPSQQTGALDISGAAIVGSVETGALDTASSGTISIGSANASAIALGNTTSNIATTINGTALVKPTTGHDSTTAFQVQPAGSSVPVLNVDTTDQQVDIGTSSGQATLTVQGATSDSTASGLIVNSSAGNSLLQVRNDGQVTLGENANNTSEAVGNNFIGTNSDNGFSHLVIASKITTGNLVPTLTSISVYVQATDTSPNNKYVVGIYTDSSGTPGSLIASSSQGTLTAGAWNTLPISVGLSADTSYWLAFSTNTTSNTTNYVPYDAGGTDTHAYTGYANAGSSMPSTFSATATGSGLDSIYANVTETGPLTTTLAISPTSGVNIVTPTNTTTALQVQNANDDTLFGVDTSGNNINIGATASTALASTVNIATSSSASNAQAINIGSESDGSNTISIEGGTGTDAVSIQAGTSGSINIGTSNANTLNFGATGTAAVASTVNIADTTGSAAQTVKIGSTSSASTTTIQGGTGGVNINVSSGNTISIGTAASESVTIGATTGTNSTTIQGEGISQKVTGSATNPTDTVQTSTNSSAAFQVQNAADDSLFNVSTLTTLINDNMVSTAPAGVLNGGSSWSSGNDVILNNGGPGDDGEVNYKLTNVGNYFDAKFNFWSQNAGNDGTWFYAYDTSIPNSFHLGSTYGGGGYAFAYYDTNSTADVYFNGTLLSSASIAAVNNATWHTAEIVGNGTVFTMYLDGTSVLTYTDSSRTLTGTNFGLGGCSCSAAGEHLAKNFTLTTDTVGVQVPFTQTNNIDTTATLGTLNVGGTNTSTINVGDNIASTTISIGDGAINGNTDTITLGSTNGGSATTIQGGTGGITMDVSAGSTIAIAGANAETLKLGSSSGAGTDTLQEQGIAQVITGASSNPTDVITTSTNSTAAFQIQNSTSVKMLTVDTADSLIIVGSNSPTNTTNVSLLQLNSYNSFSDPVSCTTTSNQGALYYSSSDTNGTNMIRGCINGSWEDMLSAGQLGLELFGVMPDSPNAGTVGDLQGISGNNNSPCKVYWSATQQITVAPCVAYSGGREVIVQSTVMSTASIAASTYVNVCLTGTGSQPAFVGSGSTTETSAGLPAWSTGAPVLCLATVLTSSTPGNVASIYDVRTFTNTTKSYSTTSTAVGLGWVVKEGSTNQVTPTTSETTHLTGIVVGYSGSTSSTGINVIIATAGPQWVKAISGSNDNEVAASATTGYVQGLGTDASGAYQALGVASTTISTACTATSNCQYSEFLNGIDIR